MVLTKEYKLRKSARFKFLKVVNMNIKISLEMMQFYVVIVKVPDQPVFAYFYHSDGDIRFFGSGDTCLPHYTASY
jgi:hypothetical protein